MSPFLGPWHDPGEDLGGRPDFWWNSSARAWEDAIARNAMIDQLRGQRRCQVDATLGGLGPVLALVERTRIRTRTYRRTDTKDRYRTRRESLSDEHQTLLMLRVNRELSWRDLAAVMAPKDEPQTPAGRMRHRFSAIKKRLRRLAVEGALL